MFDFIFQNRATIQYVAIAFLLVSCLIWGRGPERLAAVVLSAMPLLAIVYYYGLGSQLHLTRTDVYNAIIQIVFAIALIAIALCANRIYTLWMAAFQVVVVMVHLVRNLLPTTAETAYFILSVAPSYGLVASLALGLGFHIVRERRFGPYRSWRTKLPKIDEPRN